MTAPLLNHNRTYGTIEHDGAAWRIVDIEPHVAIRLKQVFPRISKTARPPFVLTGGPQLDADLAWFLSRYPMRITDADAGRMAERKTLFEVGQLELGAIYLVSEDGSDPAIMGVLGLKSSQSQGIVDPLSAPAQQNTDATRIRQLAELYLQGKSHLAAPPPRPKPAEPVNEQPSMF